MTVGASTLHSTDHLTVTLSIIKTALLIQVGSWFGRHVAKPDDARKLNTFGVHTVESLCELCEHKILLSRNPLNDREYHVTEG